MAELDTFERSLAGALLRLADDVAGAVDAAAVAHRVAVEHPRGRTTILRWRLLAVPRLPWVLLLLAALLTALVGGMLVAGSGSPRKLPAILPPVGTVFTCPPGSTPDTPGPVDQARPPQDRHMVTTFDRRAGKLVALAGVDDAVETWTFDVCTNTWLRMHPNQEPFGWLALAYVVGVDETIGVADCRDCVHEPAGTVWIYDLEANTWTSSGNAPTGVTALFYDAIAGLVVAVGDESDPYTPRKELWSYDVGTGTWAPIHQASAPSGTVFTYDVSVDRIIAYGAAVENPESVDRETRLFDIHSGTWSRSRAVTPGVWGTGMWGAPPTIVYDEAADRTVVFGGSMAAYDATADRWEVVVDGSPPAQAGLPWSGADNSARLPRWMTFDPVNGRLVGGGLWEKMGPDGVMGGVDAVVALDLTTHKWTVLLEPIAVQPTPSTS